MAEPFETLREVGVALDGFRSEVRGQFATLKWIIGGLAVACFAVAGLLFAKTDRLEETTAKNTVILERLEAQINTMAKDIAAIRDTVQTASSEPSPDAFPGWIGVKTQKTDSVMEAVGAEDQPLQGTLEDALDSWIFLPQDADR
tara:strand:+ start:2878 stop:3309 length:432 start_codon:yes stop_codon:yes gene_type:complete